MLCAKKLAIKYNILTDFIYPDKNTLISIDQKHAGIDNVTYPQLPASDQYH